MFPCCDTPAISQDVDGYVSDFGALPPQWFPNKKHQSAAFFLECIGGHLICRHISTRWWFPKILVLSPRNLGKIRILFGWYVRSWGSLFTFCWSGKLPTFYVNMKGLFTISYIIHLHFVYTQSILRHTPMNPAICRCLSPRPLSGSKCGLWRWRHVAFEECVYSMNLLTRKTAQTVKQWEHKSRFDKGPKTNLHYALLECLGQDPICIFKGIYTQLQQLRILQPYFICVCECALWEEKHWSIRFF